MIGRLKGNVLEKHAPFLLLDVNGVGYELELSLNSFCRLPDPGAPVLLYTHYHVREDAHLLYGFCEPRERDLFRQLMKTSGVGAKLALAILSGMQVDEFCRCVAADDSASLVRLPGIGKKTAQRLLLEMRDRLPNWNQSLPESASGEYFKKQEAVSAMVALGYKPAEAERLVNQVFDAGLSSEDVIRKALTATMKPVENTSA